MCCVSSFEPVKSMLPAEHHKVLANIRKAEARSKKKKQAAEQQDDSDEEEETPKTKSARYATGLKPGALLCLVSLTSSLSRSSPLSSSSIEEILAESDSDLSEDEGKDRKGKQKKKPKQKGQAWLKEGEEDEPLNFLDPKVSQRVLGESRLLSACYYYYSQSLMLSRFFNIVGCSAATNPTLKKGAKADHGFKVTSDGRLIIKEDEDEDVKGKGERKIPGSPL